MTKSEFEKFADKVKEYAETDPDKEATLRVETLNFILEEIQKLSVYISSVDETKQKIERLETKADNILF